TPTDHQIEVADQKYTANNSQQYTILFLNMRGGLETKVKRNAAFMNFYNNHFKDILGCCELKIRSMDSYTLLPRAKTIFKPGYYKIMEKNDHNWVCNGMSVTISNAHNQNTSVCPLSTDNLMITLLKMKKIAVIFVYVPPYQHCYEARIENIYKDIGARIDILEILGYRILIMGNFNGRIEDTGDTIINDTEKDCYLYKYTYYRILSDKKIGTILDYTLVKDNDFWDCTATNLSMSVIDEYVESDHLPIRVSFFVPNEREESKLIKNCQLWRFSIPRDNDSLCNVASRFTEQCKEIKLYDTICEIDNNSQYSSKSKIIKTYDTFMFWLYEVVLNCNAYIYRMTRANETQRCNLPTNLNNILAKDQFMLTRHQTYSSETSTYSNKYVLRLSKLSRHFENNNDKQVYELLSKLEEKPCHPLHDENGVPIHTDDGKCKLLTKHYQTLFQKHNDIPEQQEISILSKLAQYEEQSKQDDDPMWNAEFSEDEVKSAVISLKNNKAVFLDCIPNELWKHLLKENVHLLTMIINISSVKYQQLPQKLLLSKMTSLPKTKIPYDCNSMRGIRIKSSLVTIIDKLILARCNPVIDRQIYPEQGGFRVGCGVDDQIICLRILLAHQKYINKR
ncbi:hypothetical protein RFI_32889, partial [Reticulomyxa filosa]